MNTSLHPDAVAFVRCVADPFRNPPVKLGFGCMTPSQTVTLTARYIGAAGTDGAFTAFVFPSVLNGSGSLVGGLYWDNAVAGAGISLNRVGWQNETAVAALFEECRVVACGLRVTPMIPGTAAPGNAFVASIPSANYSQINGTLKSSLYNSPLFVWGTAAPGATVTSRPIDPESFIFRHNNMAGHSVTEDFPVSVPAVILSGLIPGYSVLVEAVMHVEGIFGLGAQQQAIATLVQPTQTNTLARVYGTVEGMWNAVKGYLPAPAAVQTAFNLANVLLSPSTSSGSGMRSSSMRYLPSSTSGVLIP